MVVFPKVPHNLLRWRFNMSAAKIVYFLLNVSFFVSAPSCPPIGQKIWTSYYQNECNVQYFFKNAKLSIFLTNLVLDKSQWVHTRGRDGRGDSFYTLLHNLDLTFCSPKIAMNKQLHVNSIIYSSDLITNCCGVLSQKRMSWIKQF